MFGNHLAHRGKIVAVADVGSASAAVALVELRHGSPATVLAAERMILPVEERSKEATVAAIGEHLVQAGEKVNKTYQSQTGKAAPVEEVYCMVHAPWSRSEAVRATSQSEKDITVTERIVSEIAKRALAGESRLDRTNTLEATVIRVELNGYPTGKPAGKRAHEIVLTALVSDCDAALRSQIQTSLEKLFPHHVPTFRSSARAILAILDKPEDERDYLIVDIVSEGATLIVVRDGSAAEQHFMPEGVHSMLKRIAPTGMPEETLNLIRMLEREQCSTAACEAIQASMAKIEPDLVRSFGEGMTACSPRQRLPDKLVLIVQPEVAPWLAKFFARIDFTQFTLTTQPFTVEAVTPKDLSRWVVPAHGIVLDTGVSLSVALVNREQGSR